MHEVEDNQDGLGSGNGKGDDDIPRPEISQRSFDGEKRTQQQSEQDNHVKFWRDDVFRHKRLSSAPSNGVPINQIEQSEQINPHNVDKVPVQTHHFDRSIVAGGETALKRLLDDPNEKSGTNDHVQSM